METIFRTAGLALGTIALTATATAQESQNPSGSDNTVISADLNVDASNFTGVIDLAAGQLCYILNVGGIDRSTAAHIKAGPDEAARSVLTLEAPTDGASGECAQIEADVARDLAANPQGYFLEVASATHPAGAVRAQLSRNTPAVG